MYNKNNIFIDKIYILFLYIFLVNPMNSIKDNTPVIIKQYIKKKLKLNIK